MCQCKIQAPFLRIPASPDQCFCLLVSVFTSVELKKPHVLECLVILQKK